MSTRILTYAPPFEADLARIVSELRGSYPLPLRSVALLLLAGDEEIAARVAEQEGERTARIARLVQQAQAEQAEPLSYVLAQQRQAACEQLLEGVIEQRQPSGLLMRERLSRAMMNPWTGIPILLVSLAALYLFVGVLGAQVMVNWLETSLFAQILTPWAERISLALIPWAPIRDLFVGPYGIVTLALRYAIAIILPIVGSFFLAFALIEDSGYLPRLAMLIDRSFKPLGLNGRAVIPMVLGFGCDTMATLVTRTLETRRERVIATMLLALAIPCSAQLGIVLGILAGHPGALVVWGITVAGVLLLVGFLAAQLLPGDRPSFYMEIPPLRLPTPSGVLMKTLTRMEWYLRELIPIFVLVSVVLWFTSQVGILEHVVRLLQPVVRTLGLPDETAMVFILGFFRRDYGAAGLYDLRHVMSGNQRTIAAVTLTLFIPCLAQFGVMLHERGWKTAVAILVFILPFAFFIGWLLSRALLLLGMSL
jgi:ferrous iron transport protein B